MSTTLEILGHIMSRHEAESNPVMYTVLDKDANDCAMKQKKHR